MKCGPAPIPTRERNDEKLILLLFSHRTALQDPAALSSIRNPQLSGSEVKNRLHEGILLI
jgi:hypothetical protein